MKRISLLTFIFITCIAIMTGCSEDPKKRFLSLLDPGTEDPQDPNNPGTVFNGPSSVTATDGQYLTKIGINWATVTDAVSYNIYRSSNVAGPFAETEKLVSIPATDLINAESTVVSGLTPDTVTTTATSGSCDEPVYQYTYQSVRDIGDGIFIWGGIEPAAEHYTIEIIIGGVNKGTVHFSGGLLGKIWTQTMIVNEFNRVLGSSATCSPVTVNGKKYIKIVSSQSILLTNEYDLGVFGKLFWVPLCFLDASATSSSTREGTRVQIACNDITRPTVTAVSPAGNATDIALNAKLSVAFSEPINQGTLNESSFTLSAGGSPVAGTVSNTGVFTPTAELISNTQYTATITMDVKDLSGNGLASNYVWTFTTSAAVSYYYVDTNVAEGSHYYYVVTAVDKDGKESKMSPVEEGFTKANVNAPSKVPSCSASDGLPGGITVTWGAAANATYYRVYRISGTGQTQVGGDIYGTTYTDTTVGPGVFSYKVAPFNAFGEGGSCDKDAGYRAVTNQEFFDLVYAEEESGLKRISHLQKTGLSMLGSETVYDLVGDGRCDYNATYSGKATVTITFIDFCDIFLTLDGTQTTVANTSGTGTITGTLNVTGVYPGSVVFDLSITSGVASGGTYTVTQSGGSPTTISGTYVPAD